MQQEKGQSLDSASELADHEDCGAGITEVAVAHVEAADGLAHRKLGGGQIGGLLTGHHHLHLVVREALGGTRSGAEVEAILINLLGVDA